MFPHFLLVERLFSYVILGNRILLDRIPSLVAFCMHLTGPILLSVVLRAHQNIDHAEKKKKAIVNSNISNYKN